MSLLNARTDAQHVLGNTSIDFTVNTAQITSSENDFAGTGPNGTKRPATTWIGSPPVVDIISRYRGRPSRNEFQ